MARVSAGALFLAGFAAVAGAQVPRVDSISPSQGPIAGGTVVTITGAGFSSASVTLDQKPIAPTSISDTQIRLSMPARDNGYALIQVAAAGQSSAAEYLYVPPKLEDLPPGYITTVAGGRLYNRLFLPAKSAQVRPWGIASDGAGRIYFATALQHRILRIRTDGILEPFAGNGTFDNGPNGDGGPATDAWFIFPRSCAIDGAGNVFIPDATNRVRRVDAKTGTITTVAGTGVAGFSGDNGPGTSAEINKPSFLAAAPDGTLYFLDSDNARIRKISTGGTITTVAGNGISGDSGDGGPATSAQINSRLFQGDANGLALDPGGFLYMTESFSGRVRRVDLNSGIISTFLPRAGDAPLDFPRAITVDGSGDVLVGLHARIVKYGRQAQVLASWGTGTWDSSPDGTPVDKVLLGGIIGLAIESSGNVIFADDLLSRIRRLNFQSGLLETVAGIGPDVIGVPGPAVGAVLNSDFGDIAFLPTDDLLFGDAVNLRIFRIDRAGAISVYSGTGTSNAPQVGCPIAQCGANPVALEADGAGGFYQTDTGGIYHADAAGISHFVAGNHAVGYAGDGGPASEALFDQTWDLALDRGGNLFIADTNNNRIRRIDAKTNIITTVAGGGPLNGFEGYGHGAYCGDGGPALDACFNTPLAVAVDPDGNIFINDFYNGRLRKVDAQGTIRTFSEGHFGKLLADAYGGLFGHAQNAVRRFLPDGSSWVVAGTPERGFSGDGGPATSAKVSGGGAGIAADRDGNLFFHDPENWGIRAVRFGAVLAPPNARVLATLGGGQSAPLMKTFSALEVTVRTASGSPAPGVRVDFAAPAGGASCVFSNGGSSISVLTDRAGKARASCRASCDPGSYEVSATPLGSATTLRFSLINTPSPAGRSRCTKQISFRG